MRSPSKTPVIIDGATWYLCGEFESLVRAEGFFCERVPDVNLAGAVFSGGTSENAALHAVRQLFPCALHTHHPDVTWDEAQKMLDRALLEKGTPIVSSVMVDMWPPRTEETDAANASLNLELHALADGEEFFQGKTGVILICVEDAGFRLEHVWRVFPCALHNARPELTLEQARALMTRPSITFVVGLLGLVNQRATQEERDRFAERVAAVTSEEDKKEFLLRIIARNAGRGDGPAQA